MSKEPLMSWDEETGCASCIMYYKDETFYGYAICADEDRDMMSEKTGLSIAESRAYIKYLQYRRNVEIKNELRGLNQLYYTMKHSTHFNPESYEARTLMRQIKIREEDMETLRQLINVERNNLTTFIIKKERFYQTIRQNRKQGQNKSNK